MLLAHGEGLPLGDDTERQISTSLFNGIDVSCKNAPLKLNSVFHNLMHSGVAADSPKERF